ncbi:stage 0 sporulation family protein [Sulfurihydrogenibium azorense]|uniref:PSP1 domain-containing protein n=1 Tax=Sulfurihydrogenibium azorense TaxID=309806 RepID=UPI00391AF33B
MDNIKPVRIRFLDTNKFSEAVVPFNIKKGDFIVIESEKGHELVLVMGNCVYTDDTKNYQFIRKATKEDIVIFDKHEEEAQEFLNICKEESEKLGLKMNLLKSYIPLNRTKALFYYTAENRVDFRELVKIMAKKIRMRIEMRQVGVRDGVQIAGAVGVCGHQCCCNLFLDKFENISVEILTEQNLPPTPTKFTGVCGRLMCCLTFEKETYSIKNDLPEIESVIEIEGKPYTVKMYDFIGEKVIVADEEGNLRDITFTQLESMNLLKPKGCGSCNGCANH